MTPKNNPLLTLKGKAGSFSTTSKIDPRFNMEGRVLIVTIFVRPIELIDAVRAKEKELGVEAPADLEYLVMKD